MRYFIHTLFIFCLLLLPQIAKAAQITEIMYDLDGSDEKREWIEIYNDTSEVIDVNKWTLTIGSETSRHGLAFGSDKGGRGSGVLQPGEFAIIASDATTFIGETTAYNGQVADSVLSLANYSASRIEPILIHLFDASGVERITEGYLPLQTHTAGRSLELLEGQWIMSAAAGGSPGSKAVAVAVPTGLFRIQSFLPNPEGVDTDNEVVVIENYGQAEASLTGWYVVDRATSSGSVHRQTVEAGVSVKPGQSYALRLSGSFLNNADEEITLYRSDGVAVEVVGFSGSAEEGVRYIRTESGWRWDNVSSSAIPSGVASTAATTVKSSPSSGNKSVITSSPKPTVSAKPSSGKSPAKSPTPKSSTAKKTTPTPSLPNDTTQVAGLVAGPPTITLSHRAQIIVAALLLIVLLGAVAYRYQLHYRLSDWLRYGILKKK